MPWTGPPGSAAWPLPRAPVGHSSAKALRTRLLIHRRIIDLTLWPGELNKPLRAGALTMIRLLPKHFTPPGNSGIATDRRHPHPPGTAARGREAESNRYML